MQEEKTIEKKEFGRGGFSRSRRPGRQGPVEKQEYETKLLDLSRVTRMSAGGRRFKFRAVVITGNRKGKVGVGVAKGSDVAQAVEKATRESKKELVVVPIVQDTIPHEITAKFGPAIILLRPQSKGRGLVAGGTVRIICQMAGIRDISAKIVGRTGNKLNNAKATIKALKELKRKEVVKE